MGTLGPQVKRLTTMQMRRIVSHYLFCLCSVLSIGINAAENKPLSSVADLRYGAALYAYYQQDYFNALTELMVADARGGIQGHGDNPAIMSGAMELAYGMTDSASDRFQTLLDTNRPAEVRDAAWFYLSKILYQRGKFATADEHLQRIVDARRSKIEEPVNALQVAIDIRMDRLQQAQDRLSQDQSRGIESAFAYYNLASVYARNGDFDNAERFYRQTIEQVVANNDGDPVFLSLYDKANTAAGYGQLYRNDYSRAIDYFQQVRLNSHFSRQALIGYGWSATENNDYAMALTPFRQLSQLSPAFAEVQEALLALPYTYEKMAEPGVALSLYQRAETLFDQEITRIDATVEEIGEGALLEALLSAEFNPGERYSYLAELTSGTKFQLQLKQLRELRELHQRLHTWSNKLSVYGNLLLDRQTWRSDKIAQVEASNLQLQMQQLQQHYQRLSRNLADIEQRQDYQRLLVGDDQDLLNRVERSAENLEFLIHAGEDTEEYLEPLRRYQGIMLWTATEKSSDLLWQRKRELKALKIELDTLTATETRVSQQIQAAPDLLPYQDRLASLSQRVQSQRHELEQVMSAVQSGLQGQLVAHMHSQQQRLRVILLRFVWPLLVSMIWRVSLSR